MRFNEFKAWLKFIGPLGLILAVIVIAVKNSDNRTDLWVFYPFSQVHVLVLIVVTAVVSVIGWRIIRGLLQAYVELRRVRASQQESESKGKDKKNNRN